MLRGALAKSTDQPPKCKQLAVLRAGPQEAPGSQTSIRLLTLRRLFPFCIQTANSEAILSSGLAESLTNNLLLSTGTSPSALWPQTCAIRKLHSNILRVVWFFLNTSLYQNTDLLAYIDRSM